MYNVWFSTISSVLIVSLVSLVGLVVFFMKVGYKSHYLKYLISLACGVLLGDVFIHLIPEMAEQGFSYNLGIWMLLGILIYFILERLILMHHSHTEHDEQAHSVAWLSLWGDAVHNFLDGMLIAVSYSVSFEVGVATTIAVILHEIPHEIGDFAILLHGGWTVKRAAIANFVTALTAIAGGIVGLTIVGFVEKSEQVLLPLGAASFIYIGMSDLIPQLHKEKNWPSLVIQGIMATVGAVAMYLLLFLE